MHVARCLCESKLTALEQMFGNCPAAVEKVQTTLGDSGELLDFWFGFCLKRPVVFYKIQIEGHTELRYALLETQD